MILRVLFIFGIFLSTTGRAKETSFPSDSLRERSPRSYFKFLDLFLGVCVNQGAVGPRYFDVNSTPAFRLNVHAFSYKWFELLAAGNYISKAYKGIMDNSNKLLSISRHYPLISNNPKPFTSRPCDLELSYFSIDLKPRITFFRKKPLQLNISAGWRLNFLLKYKYNEAIPNIYVEDYILPNLKDKYVNRFLNIGLNYNFKRLASTLTFEAEMNHDHKQYFTDWKHGRAASLPVDWQEMWGGKFSSLLFCIGYRYHL